MRYVKIKRSMGRRMANIKSAQKRVEVNARNQARNKSNSSKLKTQVKKFNKAIDEKELEKAEQMLPETFKVIDKSVTNGVLHKNAANNKKSTLAKKLSNAKNA